METKKSEIRKLARFIRESIGTLLAADCGCTQYVIDGDRSIYVGWLDGYDRKDAKCIHSYSEPSWALNIGLKRRNDDSANYDGLRPLGVEADDITLRPRMGRRERYGLARYLLGVANG